MHRCNRRMIVVTRNHLWLVVSHHKGPSNADVTSLTKIITSLQKCSWNHLWDHLCGLILDTSVIANVWFNYDFILLSEFSYTYLHQASKHQQQINVKTELDLQISTLAFIFHCFFLSCYPHFHRVSFFIMFLFFYSFFPFTFSPVTFFPPHCYFYFLLPLFLLLFFRGKIVTFFPFLYLHPDCYLFSCYFFSCYFFSYPKLLLFFLLPFFLLLSFRAPDCIALHSAWERQVQT